MQFNNYSQKSRSLRLCLLQRKLIKQPVQKLVPLKIEDSEPETIQNYSASFNNSSVNMSFNECSCFRTYAKIKQMAINVQELMIKINRLEQLMEKEERNFKGLKKTVQQIREAVKM
ncbi:Hypothetical_protein [Hexamita inflata]|uniref:Hypothetical_protein n=1 Tax=Hexamita inflata TaxID=28002 RepID=A0AA86PJM2_9EUKA|nr:Hypothetical protein HINF_LOCUS24204 [Hexamita inflata]